MLAHLPFQDKRSLSKKDCSNQGSDCIHTLWNCGILSACCALWKYSSYPRSWGVAYLCIVVCRLLSALLTSFSAYLVCTFSNCKEVFQGCCSTLSKASAPSGLWHVERKTKTKPGKPTTLHHRGSCRDRGKLHSAGLDKATQVAISNLFPSITWHFWRRDMLLERVVSLAVECRCFCIWSEPYDLSEKLN